MVNFEYFKGASRPLGWIESTCNPALDALAPGVVLASGCTATGARHLTVLSRDRDKDHCRLWEAVLAPTKVWPLLVSSAGRVARGPRHSGSEPPGRPLQSAGQRRHSGPERPGLRPRYRKSRIDCARLSSARCWGQLRTVPLGQALCGPQWRLHSGLRSAAGAAGTADSRP